MDPVVIFLSPDEVAVIVLSVGVLLGIIFTLLMIWAWMEDHRDHELDHHVDEIFRRYM